MTIQFPDKLQCLFEPHRYKVLYGGRGGTKSWGIARALLIKGGQQPLRILCAREVQKSIKQSVHTLLKDQIRLLGLGSFYEVLSTEIRGKNGTNFSFAGLSTHTAESIKSYEGIDICWVEEAKNVSNHSWKILIPTIRKDGSEIWISFNPELEDDPTYQRFVVDPPSSAKVVRTGWQDNPWFTDVMRDEMEELKRKNFSEYENVWEGKCKQAVDGAIFAEELRIAAEEHRITRVPVTAGVPVQTFWDLGQSDNTAIWFVQLIGLEYRVVDYYQASGHKMAHYINILAERGYLYDEHCLPHDAEYEQQAALSTIKQQLGDAIKNNPALGKSVRIVPRIPKKALGIDAARNIFEQCLFDKEKTADGLSCLRHYAYAKDPETGRVSKEPKHDEWSHGADGFLCFAQHFKRPSKPREKVKRPTSWMG